MSRIENVRLRITGSEIEGVSTINIMYRLLLNETEQNLNGIVYFEVIELWGADSGACEPDDYLLTQNRTFTGQLQSNGVINRDVSFSVVNSILDEDGFFCGYGDEIYAKVFVYPIMPNESSGKSNEVSYHF